MSFASDLKVLYHLVFSPIKGKTHAERLESFYSGQAGAYDSFRARLLKGRQELWESIPINQGDILIDFGGGTGANLENLGDRIKQLGKIYLVDLSSSLLQVAQERVRQRGWDNVETVEADVTKYVPPEKQVDLITFSYSLTMIPDWFAAIDQAYRLLKPGGHIAVVDFYVSRKYPSNGHTKHSWFTRSFWPVWFSSDNVFPNPDHVPYLQNRFEVQHFSEHMNRMPYMLFLKAPYYLFLGKKPDQNP